MSNNDYDVYAPFSKELDEQIIAANCPRDSYLFCWQSRYRHEPGTGVANFDKHEEIIIRNKCERYAFYFARDIVEANTDREKLKQLIVDERSTLFVSQYYKFVNQDIMDTVRATGDDNFIKECISEIGYFEYQYWQEDE